MLVFTCTECGQHLVGRSQLESHISLNHLRYTPYNCGHCLNGDITLSCPTLEELTEHQHTQHKGLSAKIVLKLDSHKDSVLQEMIQKCQISVKQEGGGKRLMVNGNILCQICGKSVCGSQMSMHKHILVNHLECFCMYECKICSHRCPRNLSSMRRHMHNFHRNQSSQFVNRSHLLKNILHRKLQQCFPCANSVRKRIVKLNKENAIDLVSPKKENVGLDVNCNRVVKEECLHDEPEFKDAF